MATLRIEIDGHCYRATVVPWIFKGDKILVGRSVKPRTIRRWEPGEGGLEFEEADNPVAAVFREAWEEFGIPQDRLKLVAATPRFPTFSFPEHDPHPTYRGKILGSYIILAPNGIRPKPAAHRRSVIDAEFDRTKWIDLEDLIGMCPKYKAAAYIHIVEALLPFRDALRIIGPQRKRKDFDALAEKIFAQKIVQDAIDGGQLTRNFPRFPGKWLNAPSR